MIYELEIEALLVKAKRSLSASKNLMQRGDFRFFYFQGLLFNVLLRRSVIAYERYEVLKTLRGHIIFWAGIRNIGIAFQ